MKTKIVIEDCYEESYFIQFTVPELDMLYRWFKRAPKIERNLFGRERYEALKKKLGTISDFYTIENELKQEKKSQRDILASGRSYL